MVFDRHLRMSYRESMYMARRLQPLLHGADSSSSGSRARLKPWLYGLARVNASFSVLKLAEPIRY